MPHISLDTDIISTIMHLMTTDYIERSIMLV